MHILNESNAFGEKRKQTKFVPDETFYRCFKSKCQVSGVLNIIFLHFLLNVTVTLHWFVHLLQWFGNKWYQKIIASNDIQLTQKVTECFFTAFFKRLRIPWHLMPRLILFI